MKEQTDYNKVVNIADDGEITLLDYTFDHGDGFKGATGTMFYPVSLAQYEEQTTLEAIEDRLEGAIPIEDIPHAYTGTKKRPYKKWAQAIIDADEAGDLAFDQSDSHLWDYLRETCGHDDETAYIYECVGCGRMFNNTFEGNVNPELSAIIRDFETV